MLKDQDIAKTVLLCYRENNTTDAISFGLDRPIFYCRQFSLQVNINNKNTQGCMLSDTGYLLSQYGNGIY